MTINVQGLTFTTTIELHLDLFVDVLAEVEDVFLLGLLLCTATTATFLLGLATTAATAPSERASFGHGGGLMER